MEPTRWLSAEEQNTWRAYLDATRLLLQALDRQLTRDAGISFTDFELLVVLSEAPGRRLRMRELADAVTTTRSGVTRAISRLVDAGWVRRVECEDDKRGTLAELTDAGAETLAAASPGHVARCAEACSTYSARVTSPSSGTTSAKCAPTCWKTSETPL